MIQKYFGLVSVALCVVNLSALAYQRDDQGRKLSCDNNWYSDRLASHCEIKEQTLPATGELITIDAHKNGGVGVKGWDRQEILLRARIQTAAASEAEARELAGQIRIEATGNNIRSEGPPLANNRHWSVTYEVFVPQQSDLSLRAYNGGISIADVRGRIEFSALNGGVSLKRLGGNVRGRATNGGLSIVLSGDRWDGEGLDVHAANGGIVLWIPENYSAHLETGTTNGSLTLDFPITVQGRIRKSISTDLGSGGATVRAITTNGGVSIKRKGAE